MVKGLKNSVVAAAVGLGALISPACATPQVVREGGTVSNCISTSEWVRRQISMNCLASEDPACQRSVKWMGRSAITTCPENE